MFHSLRFLSILLLELVASVVTGHPYWLSELPQDRPPKECVHRENAIGLEYLPQQLYTKPEKGASEECSAWNSVLTAPAGTLGDRIDGWRVCWLGGWDRGRLFYVVIVERAVFKPLIILCHR